MLVAATLQMFELRSYEEFNHSKPDAIKTLCKMKNLFISYLHWVLESKVLL